MNLFGISLSLSRRQIGEWDIMFKNCPSERGLNINMYLKEVQDTHKRKKGWGIMTFVQN